MRYLLDTNILSDLVRNPQGRVAERVREVGEAQVCTSIIVTAELRYGAAQKGSPRLSAQLEAVLVRSRFCLSRRRPTPSMAGSAPGSSGPASRSAAMIC